MQTACRSSGLAARELWQASRGAALLLPAKGLPIFAVQVADALHCLVAGQNSLAVWAVDARCGVRAGPQKIEPTAGPMTAAFRSIHSVEAPVSDAAAFIREHLAAVDCTVLMDHD